MSMASDKSTWAEEEPFLTCMSRVFPDLCLHACRLRGMEPKERIPTTRLHVLYYGV